MAAQTYKVKCGKCRGSGSTDGRNACSRCAGFGEVMSVSPIMDTYDRVRDEDYDYERDRDPEVERRWYGVGEWGGDENG